MTEHRPPSKDSPAGRRRQNDGQKLQPQARVNRRPKQNDSTARLISEAKKIGLQQIDTEIKALTRFLLTQPRTNVLEIGSAEGGSFYLWCRLFSGKKISLDDPRGNFGGIGLTRARKRNVQFRKWADGVSAILGNSHAVATCRKVAHALKEEKLDFLFIDGDHSLSGVELDYLMYRRFVRPGGHIAFHDINNTPWHRSVGCFVGPFWSQLKGEKREFTSHQRWGGIGLLRVTEMSNSETK